MTGTELVQLLRRIRSGIEALIVSGNADASGIESELLRLTQPFRNADLAELIASFR